PQRLVDPARIVEALLAGGYRRTGQVSEPGEFSRRGGILDVFPSGEPNPLRAEFYGDEVHSLRLFDVETQRSLRGVDRITVLPVAELLRDEAAARRAQERLQARARAARLPVPEALREAVEGQAAVAHPLRLLPLFTDSPADLRAYLPAGALLVLDEPGAIAARAEEAWQAAAEEAREDPFTPPAEDLFAAWAALRDGWPGAGPLTLQTFAGPGAEAEAAALETRSIHTFGGRITALVEDLRGRRARGERVHLVARSRSQAERLRGVLKEHDLGALLDEVPQAGGLAILVGELPAGFELPAAGLTYLTEAEIFGPRHEVRRRPRPKEALPFTSFEDIRYGDYVVHVDHGIGQYKGLRQITAGGQAGDFLFVKYAGADKLYVPVDKLHLVQRYVGTDAGEAGPALDRLGGTRWARAKARVKEGVRELARGLLNLYAARQVVPGHAYPSDTPWQAEFEAAFPYDETPDQLRAIQEVKGDLEAPRPMDRLVCGDVGYGKTEVALRAAFKVVQDGRQAAVLVPTTVLALQHHSTFRERFANFPARVEMLSRFRGPAEQRAVLQGLEDGTVDLVIGTHRLLQKDVRFRNLGLLVVDEEQRFGVAAKEKLKQLRREVDVLTLTATPIPRTLHMSMLGVRDISTIETPPEDRLSIRTIVTTFDEAVLAEAVERELQRGGQIFFVHNRVQTLHRVAVLLKKLFPSLRFAVAHGELPEAELERIMVDFYARKYDLLLCTTIIESGLDIATANTILIDGAERLGLAQLYQLRGRVGRDKHRAYCYLLIPGHGAMTEVARKRLQAIAELTELGSGFRIAARDLEIRGAGNLLGEEQHGHIAAVGFDLYCQLIEETVRELKGEAAEAAVDPTIRLPVPAFIPEDYVPDATLRLNLYKRLSALADAGRLDDFREEIRDRFGDPPEAVGWLLEAVDLKIRARALRLRELDARSETLKLHFA
ncbi:MAG TPA: transcription-repair coupling factor, partial [Candidatus Methylomirabilis sp.]